MREIQDKYLHTFANLTLTGINIELSNKPFEISVMARKFGVKYIPATRIQSIA